MSASVRSGSAQSQAVADLLTAISSGPSALVIEGQAGIGKTTLWLSAVDEARERGYRILSARAVAAESVLAYASLADMLDDVDPTTWAGLPDVQRLAVDRMLRADVDGPASEQRALAAGFLAVVEAVANDIPVLMAIDDLQWLDPSSANVVAYTARRLKGRVGVLATVRTEAGAESAVSWLHMPRPDQVRRMEVSPLSLGGLQMVLAERLGRSFPRPTMLRIQEVSAGNPFYALELGRAIGNYSNEVQLPGSLTGLVQTRIGRLEADVREALLAAACAAAPTTELVARATGREATEIVALLEPAEADGVINIEGHRLVFAHPLLARGVYGSAGATERRAMHRRLAQIVEEPELRARHLALAATTGDPETLCALDEAAEIAHRRGAPAAAAELIDLALGLGGDTPERRMRSAQHYFAVGDSPRAEVILEALVEEIPGGPLRAQALSQLAFARVFNGTSLDAADCFRRALAEVGDDLALRVRILTTLVWVLLNAGRLDDAQLAVDDAASHAERLGHRDLLSQALGLRAAMKFMRGGGYDERGWQRALELEDRDADTTMLVRPRLHHAWGLALMGQFDRAGEELDDIRRRCTEHGEEYDLMVISFWCVQVEIWRGDFAAASALAEDSVERARLLGGADMADRYRINSSAVAAYAGRVDQARDDAGKALVVWQRKENPYLTAWQTMYVSFLEVSLGNYGAAVATLEPLLAVPFLSEPESTEIHVAWFFPDLIESMIAIGRVDDAAPLIERLERNGRRLDRAWMLAMGARARAMLLAARGDLEAAGAAAQDAMAEHDRLPMPFERARTQLLVGQLQRRTRRNKLAATTLGEALTAFEHLGTPLWAERTRAELARVHVGPAQSGLTPTEQQVAELAASGMTNRDVAASLFISPKTVEANLSRIYHKLGIRSRAELGQRMANRGG
jgi:DNA-binding CsgD family transcriptional regulator